MQRNHAIDLMRGLSILAVILLHCRIHIPFVNHLPTAAFGIIFESGYYGVMVFFVISGFLITNSILNKWGNLHEVKLLSFYRMRFARIIPCLLVLVLLLSLLDLLNVDGFIIRTTSLTHALFAALTFHINVLEAKTGYLPAGWDVLWSLSVEEVFYIAFPLLCLLIKNQKLFIATLCLFIIAGPFARTMGTNEMWQDHGYLSCMDGIAFGIIAALYAAKFKPLETKHFFWVGFILFSLIFFFRHFVYTYMQWIDNSGLNVSILEFGIALMLIPLQTTSFKPKITKILCWYGRNSYEVYLTHALVITTVATLFKNSTDIILTYLCIILLSGLIGAAVSHYYSEPLNRWIRNVSSTKR